jgi:hypothetical protein
MNRVGLILFALSIAALFHGAGCSPSTYSTDVPVEFHEFLTAKYEGKHAWTRRTLQDEKKSAKIEQDQKVVVRSLQLTRSGSLALETLNGRIKVVFAMGLDHPISLEHFEKELLDVLWFDSPEVRYAANKKEYGTRIADAIRNHTVLKDMSPRHAYLSWGTPTEITSVVKRGLDEEWQYETLNLKKSKIIFRSGKVAQSVGDNVQDTEAARRRKNLRRSS